MSKTKQAATWEPEIDRAYEAQVSRLDQVTGSVTDFQGDFQPPAPIRQKPNNLVLPESKSTAATAYRMPEQQAITINPAQNIDQQVVYTVTPEGRGNLFIKRLGVLLAFLAVITAMAMALFSLYPHDWAGMAIAGLWLLAVATEGIIAFCVLAILDYRETPAAQNRTAMNKTIRLMAIEQGMRLVGMYGSEQYERTIKTIRKSGF